jgi:hypothetical protein
MAGWGVGLGAFAQGFAGGIGLGQKFGEMNQKRQDREAIDKIKTDGRAQFDADVAAGKASEDQWNTFFTGKILPQLQQEFAQRGDFASAKDAAQIAEMESTRQGRSLFSQALMSAQSGDMDGALGTFGKLATVPGYGPAGYTFTGTRKLADANGQPAGWAVDYRDGSGKQFSATFKSPDDFMNGLVSVYAPETRIKEMIEARRSTRERENAFGLHKDTAEFDLGMEQRKAQLGLGVKPVVTDIYDPKTGQLQKVLLNPSTGETRPIGGPSVPAPPTGFQRKPDGSGIEPIPEGPADPDYIGRAEAAKARGKGGAGPDAEAESKFRKELASRAQPYQVMRDAYGRMVSAGDDAAGDIALIFSFMRMLDPGSVVREGEFATAQNAAGIPDQVRNMYNRALEGTRLNPNQRAQFRQQGKSYYDNAARDYQALEQQFIGAAQVYGYDPDRVIPRYPPLPSEAPIDPASSKGQGRVTQGGPMRQPTAPPAVGAGTPDPLGIR